MPDMFVEFDTVALDLPGAAVLRGSLRLRYPAACDWNLVQIGLLQAHSVQIIVCTDKSAGQLRTEDENSAARSWKVTTRPAENSK